MGAPTSSLAEEDIGVPALDQGPIFVALAEAGFDRVLVDVEHDILKMPVVAMYRSK